MWYAVQQGGDDRDGLRWPQPHTQGRRRNQNSFSGLQVLLGKLLGGPWRRCLPRSQEGVGADTTTPSPGAGRGLGLRQVSLAPLRSMSPGWAWGSRGRRAHQAESKGSPDPGRGGLCLMVYLIHLVGQGQSLGPARQWWGQDKEGTKGEKNFSGGGRKGLGREKEGSGADGGEDRRTECGQEQRGPPWQGEGRWGQGGAGERVPIGEEQVLLGADVLQQGG